MPEKLGITMQVSSKGQVTIPQEIRNQLGLLPYTAVEFELVEDHALIRKAGKTGQGSRRGELLVKALSGSATVSMSTDEIMALTRGTKTRRKRK
jgi:AbrB family looped-hinge helix DNA binding protein